MTLAAVRRFFLCLLVAALVFLLASMLWPVLGLAAGVEPTGDPSWGLALLIYQGVRSGEHFTAAAGVLVLVTALARRFGAQAIPWLATDAGGTVLVLSGSLGGALLTAALAGSAPSAGLVWDALLVAFAAGGGYAAAKRLVVDPLRPRATGWPLPARVAFRAVAWIFDRVPSAPRPSIISPLSASAVVVALLATSCTGAQRARAGGAAGINTMLVCQSESLSGVALEAFELTRHYLVSTVSGAGEVDTEAIRIAARQVRTDVGRCAFAAALSAVTAAMSQRRGALDVAPSPSYLLHQVLVAVVRDDWRVEFVLDGEKVAR